MQFYFIITVFNLSHVGITMKTEKIGFVLIQINTWYVRIQILNNSLQVSSRYKIYK